MKKTPEGAERGADPVPRALTTISVLLTIGTTATDVACFTRLGGVFASVMTSNRGRGLTAAAPPPCARWWAGRLSAVCSSRPSRPQCRPFLW